MAVRSVLVVAIATVAVGLSGCSTAHPATPTGSSHGADPSFTPPEGSGGPTHFRIFSNRGEPLTLADVVSRMADVDVVLIGEAHDDPVGHWVEEQLFLGAGERYAGRVSEGEGRRVALSLEMFERDVQYVLDEYLGGLITEPQFLASSRPWEFYEGDYRVMVELAREARAPVLAANAPRRYINRVTRLGSEALDALSPQAKGTLAPLPYPHASDAYTAEWDELMNEARPAREGAGDAGEDEDRPAAATDPEGSTPPDQASPHPSMANALESQSLWDATMAHSITRFLDATPQALVLHYAGSFHVARGTGIPEAVEHYRPATRQLTVVIEPEEDFTAFSEEDHGELADVVILTDASFRRRARRSR